MSSLRFFVRSLAAASLLCAGLSVASDPGRPAGVPLPVVSAQAASAQAAPTQAPPTQAPPAQAAQPQTADARVEALIESMGGRSAWARAKGYRVEAVHYLANEPRPFANEILFDFGRPRLRIDSDLAAGRRVFAIDLSDPAKPVSWRRVAGVAQRMTAEQIESERAWWRANVYRTVHRLAVRDPALRWALLDDGRLQVFDDDRPLAWFRQNLAGEPVGFGTGDSAETAGTIFGPLAAYDGLRFPSFSVRDGGRWRAIIRRFDVDPPLDAAALTEPSGSK